MDQDNDLERGDSCKKIHLSELNKLTQQQCSILREEDTYFVCKYCTGKIQALGEGRSQSLIPPSSRDPVPGSGLLPLRGLLPPVRTGPGRRWCGPP